MSNGAFWDFSDRIALCADRMLHSSSESAEATKNGILQANKDAWANRHWLGIPGVCYTGATDSCLAGRYEASNTVLYDEHGCEFIFRQPRNEMELLETLNASLTDSFGEYGFDGHRTWTVTLVREWWKNRRRVVEWIEKFEDHSEWKQHEFATQGQLSGVREFKFHLIYESEIYLRTFAFFLSEGRCASEDDCLPELE